jgi:phage baseplate assembly protein W
MAFEEDFLAPASIQTSNVVWLDVNSKLTQNGRPDLLPNIRALMNSLFNLFQCPVGARGPIFEPEYGSILYGMLQEPLDLISSNKIKAAVVQAIQRWEPRIEVDIMRTMVVPDYKYNAFRVRLVFRLIATQEVAQENFLLNRT